MEKTISKDMVAERLKLYQTELQQLFAMQKVYEGAIQDCQHWLSVLEKTDDNNIT